MKAIKITLALALAAISAFSCKKAEDLQSSISIDKQEVSFAKEGGSQTITVTSSGEWTIKDYTDDVKSWLSVDPQSGSGRAVTVTLTALANSGEDRTASISFQVDILHKATVSVKQNGAGGASSKIFKETFESSLGNFTIEDKVIDPALNFVWSHKSNYKCACASGFYNSVNYATESWLISPEVDLTSESAAFLTFDHAGAFFDDQTKRNFVEVRKVGGDWKEFAIPTPHGNSNSYVFGSAGDIDLKEYLGSKIQFAFRYVSTASKAGTWEIQNVCINREGTPAPVVTEMTKISEVKAAAAGSKVKIKDMLVVCTNAKSYLLSDGEDYLLAYKNASLTVKKGDKVSLSGTIVAYPTGSNCMQLTNLSDETVLSSGNQVTIPEAVDVTSTFDSFMSTSGKYVKHIKFNGTLTVSGNYVNATVDGATKVGSIAYPSQDLSSYNGKPCTISGFYIYMTSSDKYVNVMLTDIQLAGHYVTATPASLTVESTATSATFAVSSDQAWTVSAPAGVTASPASGSGNADVTLTFGANTAFSPKEWEVTVSSEGLTPAKVKVTQSAAVNPDAKFVELTNAEIIKSLTDLGSSSTTYTDVTLQSASGIWKGNISPSKTNVFIQMRDTKGSYLKSPEFSSEIEKIEINTDGGKLKYPRTFYAIPSDTTIPSESSRYESVESMKTVLEGCYGKVQSKGTQQSTTVGQIGETITLTFSKSTKSFILLATSLGSDYNTGATYLNSIKVYLKK